jgi:UDP-N-acetyl-D-galactosamine dehydrogenase
MQEYGVMLTGFDTLQPADAAIVAATHKELVDAGWQAIQYLLIEGQGLVFDVKMKLDRSTLPPCVELWRL